MKNGRILIAEDELIIANINAMMLRKLGYEVQVETTAEKAIQAIAAFNPDVILMDIKFNKGTLDGIEAAHLIRENQDTPIIFTSGNSPVSIKVSMESIVHSSSLSKPINFNHLTQKLDSLVR